MGKSSAPPAPDYTGAANATAEGNLKNLQYQTQANRPNVVTPWGNQTWQNDPTFDQQGYDQAYADWQAKSPYTRGAAPDKADYQKENWTQTVSLSPDQQAALDAQMKVQANQSQLAQQMQGQVAATMSQPFNAPQMSDYMSGVPGVNNNFSGFDTSGLGRADTTQYNPYAFTAGNLGVNQNFGTSALGQNQQFRSMAQPQTQNMRSSAVNQNQFFSSAALPQSQDWSSTAQGLNTNWGSNVNQNLSYQSSAPSQNTGWQSSAPALNTNWNSAASVNTDAVSAVADAGATDLNAPQFSTADAQAGAKAAYGASTALLQDQWQQQTKQLDESLRAQGLTPGTEAYNNAMQNTQRVQAQQQNQLADQAVVTGNNMANQNYASALAGYKAGNEAQQQAYGQNLDTFNAGNTAQGQQYTQDYQTNAANNAARQGAFDQQYQTNTANNSAAATQQGLDLSGYNAMNTARQNQFSNDYQTNQANNAARDTTFNQQYQTNQTNNSARNTQYGLDLSGYQAQNAARTAQFNQDAQRTQVDNAARATQYSNDLSGYNATNTARQNQFSNDVTAFNTQNTARTQDLTNALSQYAALLQGQNQYNQAQAQDFNQNLAAYGADQSAVQAQNAAQQQAYQQAQQNYQTAYQSAYQNYLQPLNSMNAVLTGQQVGMPSFPSFATAGYVPGADQLGATSATGQWQSGMVAQQNANQASTNSTIGTVAMAAAMFL